MVPFSFSCGTETKRPWALPLNEDLWGPIKQSRRPAAIRTNTVILVCIDKADQNRKSYDKIARLPLFSTSYSNDSNPVWCCVRQIRQFHAIWILSWKCVRMKMITLHWYISFRSPSYFKEQLFLEFIWVLFNLTCHGICKYETHYLAWHRRDWSLCSAHSRDTLPSPLPIIQVFIWQ